MAAHCEYLQKLYRIHGMNSHLSWQTMNDSKIKFPHFLLPPFVPIYLSIYFSVCVVGRSISWSVGLSIRPSVRPPFCMHAYDCLSVYLYNYLSVCLSVCLSVYLSIYLLIYLPIYLSMIVVALSGQSKFVSLLRKLQMLQGLRFA